MLHPAEYPWPWVPESSAPLHEPVFDAGPHFSLRRSARDDPGVVEVFRESFRFRAEDPCLVFTAQRVVETTAPPGGRDVVVSRAREGQGWHADLGQGREVVEPVSSGPPSTPVPPHPLSQDSLRLVLGAK